MHRKQFKFAQWAVSILIPLLLIVVTIVGSKTITVISEKAPLPNRTIIIIDAGHGGQDGGAVSCTGVKESQLNLQIAQSLNDLMRLLGYQTRMLRTDENSIETQGSTIAQRKISDLKQRVKLVNETPNGILISVHQNHFSDSRYSGAQVFFAPTTESDRLASVMQDAFVQNLNPGSKRNAKRASGVYLMDKIKTVGILVECGFLSNWEEEAKLRDQEYQKMLCCVIGSVMTQFIENRPVT